MQQEVSVNRESSQDLVSPTPETPESFNDYTPLQGKENLSANKNSSIILITVMLVLFLSVGGYVAYKFINTPKEQAPRYFSDVTPTVITKAEESSQKGLPLDCQDDLDCLVTASETCAPSKVTYSTSLDLFGVIQNNTSQFEIKGLENGKCNFYLRTEKIELAFPAGIPEETVNEQKALYEALEGREGMCLFEPSRLTEVLVNWSQGTFDSGETSCSLTPEGSVCTSEGGDFEGATCSGTYFESTL